jgi:hypothetical protein
MRQALCARDLALRHALDNAFRSGLKVQVLGRQPFDKR